MSETERTYIGTVAHENDYQYKGTAILIKNKQYEQYCASNKFSLSKFLNGLQGRRVLIYLKVLPSNNMKKEKKDGRKTNV